MKLTEYKGYEVHVSEADGGFRAFKGTAPALGPCDRMSELEAEVDKVVAAERRRDRIDCKGVLVESAGVAEGTLVGLHTGHPAWLFRQKDGTKRNIGLYGAYNSYFVPEGHAASEARRLRDEHKAILAQAGEKEREITTLVSTHGVRLALNRGTVSQYLEQEASVRDKLLRLKGGE